VAALVQIQNILDADRGTVIAWVELGKLVLAAKAVLKVTQQTVFQ
jgi:hypothetical protein